MTPEEIARGPVPGVDFACRSAVVCLPDGREELRHVIGGTPEQPLFYWDGKGWARCGAELPPLPLDSDEIQC